MNGSKITNTICTPLKKRGQGDIPLVCLPHWGREGVTLIASLKKIQKWVIKELFISLPVLKKDRVYGS